MKPKAIVLRTAGTNCDEETAYALELAGARAKRVHINRLTSGEENLLDYQILVIPGGFSYGDDISAGKLLANELRYRLGNEIDKYIASGRLVIGICNGFQVLLKANILPGFDDTPGQSATLTDNDSGRFVCRWVWLKKFNSACRWLNKLPLYFELPIAHGEGKFVTASKVILNRLTKNRQLVFAYHGENPNGSMANIAGICNARGNVVGLMPHPERFVNRYQHPLHKRMKPVSDEGIGLDFFRAAVEHIKNNQ